MAMGPEDSSRRMMQNLSRHHYAIRSYLTVAVGDHHDAEDLYQDVTMTIWERRADFRPGTNFCAWALTVARNRVLAYHKKRRAKPAATDPRVLDRLMDATQKLFEHTDVAERKRALRACLERLSDRAQAALESRYQRTEPLEQVARRMGRSLQGYYATIKRARAALRDCVQRTLDRPEVAR